MSEPEIREIRRAMLQMRREVVLLTAGHLGLRRFLLEWHSQSTGTPMNRTEEILARHIQQALDQAIASMPPAERLQLDPRQPPPAL